ncbi:protein-disulfide reductase DsbD [Candidatus Marithrix sp. Canyon 246]|uniref:protein-disulfide reductase DsbD n=1 Tax=Candidatus Marithrix sp. Canyon 246 TaxID=1827136 RepID=UPI0009F22E4C|nr:protein-disulfide reductase DsbD [Candidatus Marithrix sp. Canyon 246]
MIKIRLFLILISWFFTLSCYAIKHEDRLLLDNSLNISPLQSNIFNSQILPPDQAFVFSTYMDDDSNVLIVRWEIADGYYLYRDQFKFALEIGGVLGDIQFPVGKFKDDAKYGRVEVYENLLEIRLPVNDVENRLELVVNYQGCADGRLCYPPIEKVSVVNVSNTKNHFIKASEAFIFSAKFASPSYLVLTWHIADGYYLYKDKFNFSLESKGQLGVAKLPTTIVKFDKEIYQQPELEIIVPIKSQGLEQLDLKVEYQGCAVAGYCYPPITKLVHLSLGEVSEQDRLAKLLTNSNIWYALLVFFGLGLLLSLTPCVFPMIPILSSIIVGQAKDVTTYKAFVMSLVYVLAMAVTYAVLGVVTGLLGENLQVAFQDPLVLVSFALLFVILSLSMFGFYELQLPQGLQTKLTSWSNSQQGGTLIGVAIMGVLSAVIVGPCIAPPLAGALLYISQTNDALFGGLALFVMSLGMGIPLIIIGISAGHWLPKVGAWMDSVKAIFGVILLAVAIWMLDRVLPEQVIMLLWASLLIVSAVYMGALDAATSGWSKLWKGFGIIFLVYGVLLIIGATSNNAQIKKSDNFIPIKGVNGLNAELAAAKNKLVMLDFSAEWCVSCQEMDDFTFSDSGVQKLLVNFVLLKADVTANDIKDKALYNKFGIFGPPAILFFDQNGQEQVAFRVVGFMSAEKFRQHLKKIIQL